ncbi:MAG: DUF4336 domain-containing protein [Cyanobacteria bacterium P01_A01_bin.83]
MLQQVDRNLWVAEQPLKFMGLPVGTRMTVICLTDNSLLLISPIQITSEIQQQLDDLGTVKYIIAPNLFHYLYLADCRKIYSQALVLAPPGLKEKQPNLKIDSIFAQDDIKFDSQLEYTLFTGFQTLIVSQIKTVNEIVFYHPSTKTLIITDSAFNFDRSFPLVTQFAARIIGSYQQLKPSWLEKIAVKDKQKTKQSIEQILSWDFERVIMGHGKIVETNAKQQLAAGYQWLVS